MKLRPENSPFPRLLVWPLVLIAAFGWFWLRWRPDIVVREARCPLKDATGIPCPTCGGTHAAVALARLDVAAAWTASPLVTAAAFLFAAWALWAVAATLVPRWRLEAVLGRREKKAARILAASVILLGWAWQFRA